MTIILGINSYHGDSSACILKDGYIIAAAEEERFNRVKHWAGIPVESIKFCLNELNLKLCDVDHIAINNNPLSSLDKKIIYSLLKKPEFALISNRILRILKNNSFIGELNKYFGVDFHGKIHKINHHYSHLASSYFISPFEKSVVLSVDGFGDFASTTWGMGYKNTIKIDGQVYFPHSLGIFYQSITQWLGFKNYGDEYKAMGLSAYGRPIYIDKLRKLFINSGCGKFKLNLKYFRHHIENTNYCWNNSTPFYSNLFSDELENLIGPRREQNEKISNYHMDIASSMQYIYEEVFFELLNYLYLKYEVENLSLSGGCALNSVANGKITSKTKFKNVYVPPAAGDAGGAIGSALSTWINITGKRILNNTNPYLGPKYEDKEILELLRVYNDEIKQHSIKISSVDSDTELVDIVASYLSNGSVVGWFQGRMEWGSRALGNRSILCDPRIKNMKDLLNLKIKKRESFRPFAPSVLEEYIDDWFISPIPSPYMTFVVQIREDKKNFIPAVTHIDGTGRVQTVNNQNNKLFHSLISKFFKLTNVPMLLNTSFNENEPIVCKPEEALKCFLRTKMDILVMGKIIISR